MKTKLITLISIFLLISISALFYYQEQNKQIDIAIDFSPINRTQNTTIFAAYSADGSISDYVITYLKLLKQVTPNIVFITDNPIKKSDIKKLTPYVNHLEATRHQEYDWGSYKRGYNWLINQNISSPYLVLTNDSVLPIINNLKPIFESQSQADFFGITANQDGTYHLQSYFLAIKNNMYQSQQFANYLNSVQHQPDGLTVAYRYEVPFTQYFENLGYTSSAYIPYETLSYLPLNDKNCYPLTLLSKHNAPFLKMRTFTNRLNVQESRRLVFNWLKNNTPQIYDELIAHLKKINSPYLKDNR